MKRVKCEECERLRLLNMLGKYPFCVDWPDCKGVNKNE